MEFETTGCSVSMWMILASRDQKGVPASRNSSTPTLLYQQDMWRSGL